jgi:hypothetical protein
MWVFFAMLMFLSRMVRAGSEKEDNPHVDIPEILYDVFKRG